MMNIKPNVKTIAMNKFMLHKKIQDLENEIVQFNLKIEELKKTNHEMQSKLIAEIQRVQEENTKFKKLLENTNLIVPTETISQKLSKITQTESQKEEKELKEEGYSIIENFVN